MNRSLLLADAVQRAIAATEGRPEIVAALDKARRAAGDGEAALVHVLAACHALLASPSVDESTVAHLADAVNRCFDGAELDDLPELAVSPTPLTAARGAPRAHALPDAHFVSPSLPEDDELEDLDDEPFDEDFDPLGEESPPASTTQIRDPDARAFAELDVAEAEDEAARDADLADFGAPSPIQVLADVGRPLPLAAFESEIVSSICDTLTALARDRALLPFGMRAQTEARILQQVDAILSLGPACLERLVALDALDANDPWTSWGPLFCLGCVAGRESLRAIAYLLEALPDDAARVAVATEALALAPHPDLARAADLLRRSPHPGARAVGIALYERRKGVDPERVIRHLDDPHPVVMHAAIASLARCAPIEEALPVLRARLHAPWPAVSFAAARLLLSWGDLSPYAALQRDDAPLSRSPQVLEIYVMAGQGDDLTRMDRLVRRLGPSATVLDGIARFGHPRAWGYLCHVLGQADHAESAAAALETLFGARVEPDLRLQPAAWRAAIAAGGFDEATRYRGGEPWRAASVLEDCASGRLSRRELRSRLDELSVRCEIAVPADLAGWTPGPDEELRSVAERHRKQLERLPAGRWLG